MASSREFQIFAKPGGAICNLDCRYCYYLEKECLYPDTPSFRMSDELLEEYIVQHIEAFAGEAVRQPGETSGGHTIRFSWHGGEPTILGLDYFRKIVSLQKKHAPTQKGSAPPQKQTATPGSQIVNAIVTNGTLLDEEWCRFLAAEGFAVGLSVDGPADLHDHHRVTKGREPTHERVMRGFRLLKDHGVPCDILCVVHDQNVRHPLRVFRFFKEVGATYLGFLPLVERRDDQPSGSGEAGAGRAGDGATQCGGVGEHTIPADAYGSFLCTIFDEWVQNDIGRIQVQIFDEAARPTRGLEHSLCIVRETCGDIPVLEHNGDLYSCDHFVAAEHLLGNIRQVPLAKLLASPAHAQFGNDKRDSLPRFCRECDVLDMCNGGCPKDRFIQTPDGEEGLNYLCAGFKRFFTHARPVFEKLVPRWKAGASAEQLMNAARDEGRGVEDEGSKGTGPGAWSGKPREARPGRNDPCPCGSGRKYKKCCLG